MVAKKKANISISRETSVDRIAFWAKESDASISNKKTRTVFALPSKDGRPGAGDVEMGWDGNRIRALRGDYQRTNHVRWGYERPVRTSGGGTAAVTVN